MPVITIRIAKGRPVEIKRVAAQTIADAVVSTLGVRREWVVVLFDEYDRENWATGGELHSDKFGSGFGTTGTAVDASGGEPHGQ